MRVKIGLLVPGKVMIKILIRVRVRVVLNVSVYHWSNCRRIECRIFLQPAYEMNSFCEF